MTYLVTGKTNPVLNVWAAVLTWQMDVHTWRREGLDSVQVGTPGQRVYQVQALSNGKQVFSDPISCWCRCYLSIRSKRVFISPVTCSWDVDQPHAPSISPECLSPKATIYKKTKKKQQRRHKSLLLPCVILEPCDFTVVSEHFNGCLWSLLLMLSSKSTHRTLRVLFWLALLTLSLLWLLFHFLLA